MARSDERWRQGRKLLDRGLRPGAIASHRPMLETRTHLLLSRLLTNPHRWEAYIDLSVELLSIPLSLVTFLNLLFSFQGESILAMTYGYAAQEHDDRIIDAAKRINKLGAETFFPGPLLVNYLPFRMYCKSVIWPVSH